MRRVAAIGTAVAALYVLRGRLVRLLTATTGTWVGSPSPPTSEGSAPRSQETA